MSEWVTSELLSTRPLFLKLPADAAGLGHTYVEVDAILAVEPRLCERAKVLSVDGSVVHLTSGASIETALFPEQVMTEMQATLDSAEEPRG